MLKFIFSFDIIPHDIFYIKGVKEWAEKCEERMWEAYELEVCDVNKKISK
jgi:hypothetical protein